MLLQNQESKMAAVSLLALDSQLSPMAQPTPGAPVTAQPRPRDLRGERRWHHGSVRLSSFTEQWGL